MPEEEWAGCPVRLHPQDEDDRITRFGEWNRDDLWHPGRLERIMAGVGNWMATFPGTPTNRSGRRASETPIRISPPY